MADVVRDVECYKSTDGTPVHAIKATGADSLEIILKYEIPDESDAASIFRLCEVPSNFVLTAGTLTWEEVTGCTDNNLGLYENAEHGSGVILADMFIDGQSFAAGGSVSVLTNLNIEHLDKTFYELAETLGVSRDDVSSSRQSYVIGLSLVNKSTAAGTIVLKLSLARKS